MGYETKNRGVLFINQAKKEEDHADSSGKLDIEGVDYYVDAWLVKQEGKDQQDIRVKRKGSTTGLSDGGGFMHRVDKQGKDERYPDWKGELKMETGDVLEISGWKKHSTKNDVWFLSLSVGKKSQRAPAPAPEAKKTVASESDSFQF